MCSMEVWRKTVRALSNLRVNMTCHVEVGGGNYRTLREFFVDFYPHLPMSVRKWNTSLAKVAEKRLLTNR